MDKRKLVTNSLLVAGLLLLATAVSCSAAKQSTSNQSNTATPRSTPQNQTASPQSEPGALKPGEATGSYTAKGETVILKYAYAGRDMRFGTESIVVLLTDKPIPPESLADEIKSQTLLLGEKIRGLEYAFSKDGYWVRFHPGQYQESKSAALKDYSVENDIVKGSDEDKGDLTNGKYSRSVKFVATIVK